MLSIMCKSLKIIVPSIPKKLKEVYFRGYINHTNENLITIFITKYGLYEEIIIERKHEIQNIVYGYYADSRPKKKKLHLHFMNYFILNQNGNLELNKLVLNGESINTNNNCIIMEYDYDKIRDSETICETTDYVSKLQDLVLHENTKVQNKVAYQPIFKKTSWFSSSMFLQHVFNYLNMLYWLRTSIRRDKRISIKQGNMILAIIMDVILGYLLLEVLTQDKKDISSMLLGLLEKLINSLYSLLKWLMGAPVGLKLNNAFNKMLGKYFSYHVQLWWLFLDVSGEKLDIILHIYQYLGYLGFTFQAAMISDLICIATFHSYCIYVYAARLFNIQISGLIALLRLFVGRKYNPLRGGIDSCEYTNPELFVGTVAFTILLLLLPTTTMYYIVFTLFRVLSLIVQFILAKLISLIQTSPLYVVTLWLVRSPKVAGNVHIEVKSNEAHSPMIVRIKLISKSLGDLVSTFQPPVEVPKHVEWTNTLSNVFTGKQII